MPVTGEKIVSVEDLCFSYGQIEVLHNVRFEVEKGDYIALAGPNGAGKTTLIKLLLGLLPKRFGKARLFGLDIENFDSWAEVGYLPQRVNVFNPLFPATVREVVALGLLSKKRFPKKFTAEDEVSIGGALELLDIGGLKDKLVSDLSGGQQQRVFLARALVSGPKLLIMDEPTTALDPVSRENFFSIISRLNRENGLTIILITHDTSQMGSYAGKLLYLDKTVVFYGRFSDFCHSQEMTKYFGPYSQHLICHQHQGT